MKLFILIIITFAENCCAKDLNVSVFKAKELVPFGAECNRALTMGLQILFRYFDDQHFMTFMDLSDDHSLDGFKCTKGNIFRPLTIYKSWNKFQLGPKIDTSSVTSLPTIQGYFIKCRKVDVLDIFYKKFANYNPKTKLMFQLIDETVEAAKEVLKVGYEKYKILNVAVVVFVNKFFNGKLSHYDATFCMLNPFSGSKNVRSPAFDCKIFNVIDFEKQLNQTDEFIKSRITNLQEYPLKIDIFPYPMVSKAIYDENLNIVRYGYADGEIANIVSRKMNFTPIYIPPTDNLYGFSYPNGSFTGSLAALEYEQVDYVANPRLISNYQTTKAVFLQPITTERYKFIIQKRLTKRRMMVSLFTQYDRATGILTIFLMILFPITYFCINYIEAKISERQKSLSLSSGSLYVFGLYHNLSMSQSKSTSSRIITITIVFYALIMTALFQGTIIKDLNLKRNIGDIKKIEELLDLDYTMLLTHTLHSVFQEQSGDRLHDKLSQVAKSHDGVLTHQGLKSLLESKNVAFLWDELYTRNYLDRFYNTETGENLLEVVPEIAFEFYIAMMAPKISPFIDIFNRIILQTIETGINTHQIILAKFDNDEIRIQRMKRGLTSTDKLKSLNIRDLGTLFRIYIIFTIISCVAFAIEILIKVIKKKL